MTLTFTPEQLYIGIIVVLIGIQIYQQRLIKKLEKETEDIWAKLGTVVGSLTTQILGMQKDINSKQDKK